MLVLDFTTLLPGPLATLWMRQAGARVIKVERPPIGDEMREYEPRFGTTSVNFALLNAGKESVALEGLAARLPHILEDIQLSLHRQALERRDSRTTEVGSVDEAREAAQTGFARVPWDVVREAEEALARNALTVRCLQRADGGVPVSSDEPDLTAVIAKAY